MSSLRLCSQISSFLEEGWAGVRGGFCPIFLICSNCMALSTSAAYACYKRCCCNRRTFRLTLWPVKHPQQQTPRQRRSSFMPSDSNCEGGGGMARRIATPMAAGTCTKVTVQKYWHKNTSTKLLVQSYWYKNASTKVLVQRVKY